MHFASSLVILNSIQDLVSEAEAFRSTEILNRVDCVGLSARIDND